MTGEAAPAVRLAVPLHVDPAALAGLERDASIVSIGGATMGTGWRVAFVPPERMDPRAVEAAIAAMLDGLVAELSHWEEGSLLSRFNRAAASSWAALPPAFAEVMAAALAVAARSDGAFDPAAGALVDLWGFGTVPVATPPDAGAVAAVLAHGGWRRLAFDPAARRLRQPGGLRLDLSGIAKGYAVDRLAALLGDHGIRHALCEIGGEFVGLGLKPDGDPWWVELETPGGVAAPLRVALHKLAVATSGDYVRGRHTIDPRTGRPVQHVLAVSVIHRRAMLADAWATALGASTPEEMRALAVREGLAARALLRTEGGVAEWISPALGQMLS